MATAIRQTVILSTAKLTQDDALFMAALTHQNRTKYLTELLQKRKVIGAIHLLLFQLCRRNLAGCARRHLPPIQH
jgi:hypothetical protein